MSKLDVTPTDDPGSQTTDSVLSEPTQNDPFAELVGEGKRYKTPAELAKGKLEADAHIKQLEKEAAERQRLLEELEEKAKRSQGIDEAIAKLKTSQSGQADTPAPVSEQVIDERIQAARAKERMEANLATAEDALIAKHGGDVKSAKAALLARAEALGTTPQDLLQTAMRNPTMFSELMGIQKGKTDTSSSAPDSDVDPMKLGNQHTADNPAEGTNAWYQKLRRENPSKYMSRTIQNKMIKDAREKGADFYL